MSRGTPSEYNGRPDRDAAMDRHETAMTGRARGPAAFLPWLAALMVAAPVCAFAQNNSFATVIQNNATMQANLTRQMINLGGATAGSGAGTSPAPCLPPFELQRGVNGQVPPALQGDPRYQQYLRCRQGQGSAQQSPSGSTSPTAAAAPHLPITATDFMPAHPGHPVVDQAIVNMPITPEQRQQLRRGIEAMFQRVASQYRGNNMAVSVAVAYSTAIYTLNGVQMSPQDTRELVFGINDRLAQEPQFAQMAAREKQNNSDSLIFQSAMISMLRDIGQRDPQARQQAVELSRAVLGKLTGS
jgi:hypothetical protein